MTAAHGEDQGTFVSGAGANQVVLQQFWLLASEDQAERTSAAEVLVQELLASQKQHAASSNAAVSGKKRPHEAMDADGDDEQGGATRAPGPGNRQQQLQHALKDCSPLMVYSLRRLARGLASGRGGARQGFGAALAVLLAQGACVSAEGVLVLLEACLQVSSAQSGADQREALLGRVFGLAALVRSGLAASPAAVTAVAEQLLGLGAKKAFLREAAGAVVCELLAGAQQGALEHALQHGKLLQQALSQTPDQAQPEALLLALQLWHRLPASAIAACKLLPHQAPPPPAAFWNAPESVPRAQVEPAAAAVLSQGHLTALLPLLLSSSASHPRMHQAWGCLLALLLPGFRPSRDAAAAATMDSATAAAAQAAAKGAPDPTQLAAFWGTVVEGGLFQGSSHERKHLGLQLFQLVLPHLTADTVQSVLSARFVGCLAQSLKDKQSYLHVSAKRCVDRLVGFAERRAQFGDKDTPLTIAAALQRRSFDAKSSSHTTNRLLGTLDAAGVDAYVARLIAEFEVVSAGGSQQQQQQQEGDEGEEDEQEEEEEEGMQEVSQRRRVVEQLCAAVRFPAASEATVERALRFLAVHAFFVVAATPAAGKKDKKGKNGPKEELSAAARCSPVPSRDVRQFCAAKLVGLVGALGHPLPLQQGQQQEGQQGEAAEQPREAGGQPHKKKAKKEAPVAAQSQKLAAQRRDAALAMQERLLANVLGFIAQAQASPGVSPALDLPGDMQSAVEVLREINGALAAVAGAAAGSAAGSGDGGRAKALLLLVRLLQLQLLADPLSFDAAVATDLRRVAVRGMGVRLEEQEESEDEEADEEEGEEGAGGPGRQHWMDVLLDVLLSLLAAPPGALPIAPLRDAAEALFRVCAPEMTAMGLADLVRVVGQRADEGEVLGDAEEEEEGRDDDGSDDGDDDDESEEESEQEDERAEAGQAANGKGGAAGKAAAGGSDTDGSDDDEGSDLDDDAMDRLDAVLGSTLRSMVGRRSNAKERGVALANLKFRALALLEEWLKRVPGSPLILDAVPPLLRAASNAARSDDAVLASRLRGLLGGRLAKARPDLQAAGQEALAGALRKALYYASRERDQGVASGAAQVLLALLSSASAAGGAAAAAASDTAAAAASDVFTKKRSRLPRGFLHDLLMRCPGAVVGGPALGRILVASCSARSDYLQAEALQALTALFKGPQEQTAANLAAISSNSAAFSAALCHAVTGPFKAKERHVAALKAACSCLEGVRKVAGKDKRLAEVLGPDALPALAKSVLVVREAGVPAKVNGLLTNLVGIAQIGELLARTKPDPARLAALRKQRQALEASGAAAAGGSATAGGAEGGTAAKGAQRHAEQAQPGKEGQHQARKQGKEQEQRKQGKQHQQQKQEGKQQQPPSKTHKKRPAGEEQRAPHPHKVAKAQQASPAQQSKSPAPADGSSKKKFHHKHGSKAQ